MHFNRLNQICVRIFCMNTTVVLNKLPQELVNQIAAGEVIERPASVVKELVDNSIDAKASEIRVKVVNGGMDLIEVSDNGEGIPRANISEIFTAHTTSKISSFEDLNNLLTMGFRGEALSTILSVSNIRLISKYSDEEVGSQLVTKDGKQGTVKSSARESGTAITVENLFENVPARRKFLKSEQTEYKRVLEILFPYFLIYPNIHFILERNSKEIFDLRSISNAKPNTIEKERLESLLKEDFVKRMLKVFYDGSGTKISGYVGHPSDHQKRANHQYIFVNARPIKDNGIARAVYQGFERYIPHGQRVPYILLLNINPELIDVNVHPRKEEVRFLNPYRVYSAVQEAVKKAVEGVTSYRVESREYTPSTSSRDISFGQNRNSSVKDSLLFSKEVLDSSGEYVKERESSFVPSNPFEFEKSEFVSFRKIFQIFNKYIVIEFEDETLWIIDQHAAAERITFEKLKNAKKNELESQNLLVPIQIEMSKIQLTEMEELKKFFEEVSIKYDVLKDHISITTVPVEFVNTDFKKFLDEILSLGEDVSSISKELTRLKEDIYATMSCHSSVRSGQELHTQEMIDMYKKLIVCENPYSCPHGRPAVWKLKLSEIDMNFERTY